ncbi:TLDc domain-containing protein [Entamoeba marina]
MKRADNKKEFVTLDDDAKLGQFENSIKPLIKWSGKQNYNIIFDSDVAGNCVEVLPTKLMNKKNLYFIIFDNQNNVFGGYINVIIGKKNSFIKDPTAFVFSLIRNEKVKNMKYDIKKSQQNYAFYLFSSNDLLFQFGYYTGYCDIVIPKIGYVSIWCNCPNSYENNGEKQPLRDNTNGFSVDRLLVLEMS